MQQQVSSLSHEDEEINEKEGEEKSQITSANNLQTKGQSSRRQVRQTTVRYGQGFDKKEKGNDGNFVLKHKTQNEFTMQSSLNNPKNQKIVEVLDRLQKELIDNYSDDVEKQVQQWVAKQKTLKDKNNSISFTPHTLQMNVNMHYLSEESFKLQCCFEQDFQVDESRVPRIVETIKQLVQIVESSNVPTEELEAKTFSVIEDEFIRIYKKIENAFDEEATIDISVQNGYIQLKGRRAFKLLSEFTSVFSENEPIYKIFPLSKSESFSMLQKFNVYIKKYIIKEDDNANRQAVVDLNMEKINIYLSLIERLQSCLDTLTKNFKNHAQALEAVLKKILNSEMIAPFYDAKIDFSSAPEEATTSISTSKNKTLQFQDKNNDKKRNSGPSPTGGNDLHGNMDMIEESEGEIDDDEEDEEKEKQENSKGKRQTKEHQEGDEHHGDEGDDGDDENAKMLTQSCFEKLQFQIEYLKPGKNSTLLNQLHLSSNVFWNISGNIPWDLQTIRSEGKIGSGGQGTVFKAFDPTKERQIALKFTNIPCNWQNHKESYLQEIKIQSYMTYLKIDHILEVDNKVYIYQDKYGQQQIYLVSLMELGVGSLEDFIQICSHDQIPISAEEIFNIFFDILDGLDGMHTLGFAHKDIKPQNVIFSIKDKSWKIADFGCIQRIFPENTDNSDQNKDKLFLQDCIVTGTPSYMSPELYQLYQQRQEQGKINLIANDYYSLGVLLLKMREMKKIDRSKLSEKVLINSLASDRLSKLIAVLLDDDQVNRSQLRKSYFIERFKDEYERSQKSNLAENYLEQIFKYDENAQDNLNIAQKLECAKTYQNINLREKCLRYFDEVVTDTEFENLELFEKRGMLVDQAQALSYFGDYDKAYEQQLKCLQISSESLKGFRNSELLIADIKFLGQILFNQGNYDLALQKYIQALTITREEQSSQIQSILRKSIQSSGRKRGSSLSGVTDLSLPKRKPFQATPAEKSAFSRNKPFPISESIQQSFESEKKSTDGNQLTSLTDIAQNEEQKDSAEKHSLSEHLKNHSLIEIPGDNISQKEHSIGGEQKNERSIGADSNYLHSDSHGFPANFQQAEGGRSSQNNESEKKTEGQGEDKNFTPILIHPPSLGSIADIPNDYLLNLSNGGKSMCELGKNNPFDLSIEKLHNVHSITGNSEKLAEAHPIINQLFKDSAHSNLLSSNSNDSRHNTSNFTNTDSLNLSEEINQKNSNEKGSQNQSDCSNIHETMNTSFNSLFEKLGSNKEDIILQVIECDNSISKEELKGFSQPTQNDIASIQTLIGQALNKLGHYDKALKYYEEALITSERNLGKKDTSVAFILDSMGECQVNNGKYKESFGLFKRSYRIKRAEYGKNSVHLADTINSMGKVLEKLTLYEKSAQHYQKALHIYEQHYGHNHIKTAEILNNLGSVKRAEGDYKQAYKIFKEVLSIASNHYPSDHIELGKIYHDIGNVLRNQDNLELSLEYFLKAKEIKMKHYGANHVEVSNTCQYIGIIYRKMEKLELAQQYFELALGPMVSHYGKDHIEVVKLVQEIAVLLQIQGKDLQAKEKLDFVLENRIKEFGVHNIKTANTMQNVATVEMELGNYSKSLEYTLQVLEVRKQTFGDSHLKVANSHTSVGQLQDLVGDYASAIASVQHALDIYALDPEPNKSKIQSANIIRVRILLDTLRFREACEFIETDLLPNLKPGSASYTQALALLAYAIQSQSFILNDQENEQIMIDKVKQEKGDEESKDQKAIQGLLYHQSWLKGNEDRIASPAQILNLHNQLKSTEERLETVLLQYEKNYGKEHYMYAQILEQKALLAIDEQLAQTALEIKLQRFMDTHIEIINSHQIILAVQFYKQVSQMGGYELLRESECAKELAEKLKTLLSLKIAFYNSSMYSQSNLDQQSVSEFHCSALNTQLLLYRITRDDAWLESLTNIISNAAKDFPSTVSFHHD